MNCKTALLTVLDQVDYTNGACGVTEMVGAVLPKEIIALARKAIADEDSRQSEHPNYCNPVNGVHAPFCTGHCSSSELHARFHDDEGDTFCRECGRKLG